MLLATWREVISKVWYYLNYPYTIGNLKGSVTSLIGGAVIFAAALLPLKLKLNRRSNSCFRRCPTKAISSKFRTT